MARIIFNEDPNHFIYSRSAAGVTSLTDDTVRDFILQYQGTQITDFMLCTTASAAWFDSEKTKGMIAQYKEWLAEKKYLMYRTNDPGFSHIKLLADYYDRTGKVMQDVWIETLREIGIRPWISIRMNDIHDCKQEDSILFSDFYRANRHRLRASHRPTDDYFDYALDYMYPEVREHYLTMIGETLDRFDTDGIEIDWMREIYSVGIGREYEGIAVLNDFMARVYALVKAAEEKRAHRIEIGVRMPETPEMALRFGFDIFEWVERGYVDLITVTPRWSSVNNDMPIDLWTRIFRGKPVTIAAGLEILIDAYNRRGRRYMPNCFESAIGSACANLFMGADATYLFNYMDAPQYEHEGADGEHSLLHGETYRKFLCTVGDYESCQKEKRRHIVTYGDVSAIGAPGRKPLPVTVAGQDGKAFGYRTLRLVTGEIPKGADVRIVLGILPEEPFDPSALRVYLSARPCRLVGEVAAASLQYADMRYFVFVPETDEVLPPVSVIEIGITEGRQTVHWAEIDIDPTV